MSFSIASGWLKIFLNPASWLGKWPPFGGRVAARCVVHFAACRVLYFAACRVVHFAARDSAIDTSAAFRKCFLPSAKKFVLCVSPRHTSGPTAWWRQHPAGVGNHADRLLFPPRHPTGPTGPTGPTFPAADTIQHTVFIEIIDVGAVPACPPFAPCVYLGF